MTADISKITHELLQIHDLDMLLEHMLTEIRNLIGADAGSVYLVEESTLKFSYTQNSTLQKKLPFGKKLIYSTFSIKINNKSIAGYVANTGISTNISDAYLIDEFQPYSFDKHFDETSGYRTHSMLTVPIKNYLGRVIGVIQLINAIDMDQSIRSFTAAEESIVRLFADSASIAIEHAKMIRSMIMCMNKMLELHDHSETVEHNNRVAAYSVEIYEVWAHKKGVPEKEIQHNCDILRMAAMLHDVGKISVPSEILKKPFSELNGDEIKIFEQYTVYGARLFYDAYSSFEEMARIVTLNHNEKWDGSGYPGHVRIEDGLPQTGYEKADGTAFGKKGNEIPIYARIVAIANTYDKQLHSSVEKERLEAVNSVLHESGKQFDPDIVAAFIGCLEIINSINGRYPDKN